MDYTQFGSFPLTCLTLLTLPRAYAPVSIAVGVIRASKPPHAQHVLRQGGSRCVGMGNITVLKRVNSPLKRDAKFCTWKRM